MQKNWCLIFVFVLLVGFVSAIDTSSIDQQFNSVDQKVHNITSQVDTAKTTLPNEDVRNAYLKKQLGLVLENKTGLKQVISAYRKAAPYTNPAIEFFVGMTPVFSLFFVLVLVIWFFLVKYYFTFYAILRDFSTFSNRTSFIISFGVFIILLIVEFFQTVSIFLANQVVNLTEFLTSPIMKIIAFVVFVVAIVFLSKFSKQVIIIAKSIRKNLQERRKYQEEELLAERQEKVIENLEETSKAMTGGDD